MRNAIIKASAVLALGASSIIVASSALAEEWPFMGGDYWEVTGISIKDGGGLKYSNWLAGEWRKDAEFAKSKGWIKDYKIFASAYPRAGEPDLYLIRVREDVPSGAEGEKRQKEYMDWQEKSLETLVGENGNRAEYREVMSSELIQELLFRD